MTSKLMKIEAMVGTLKAMNDRRFISMEEKNKWNLRWFFFENKDCSNEHLASTNSYQKSRIPKIHLSFVPSKFLAKKY